MLNIKYFNYSMTIDLLPITNHELPVGSFFEIRTSILNMISNKNTAGRFVNLAQNPDIGLREMTDFATLKIHRPEVTDDAKSKRLYFESTEVNGQVKIAHVLEESPNVGVHFQLTVNGKTTININVYRFNEAGKLIEIWTNSQEELPARADGTILLNGTTAINDLDKTEENSAFTNDIYENVMVRGQSDGLTDFFADRKMRQHNVMIENDLAGNSGFIQGLATERRAEKIKSYELCVCEGNFSITATNANFGAENWAFFDIQRLENGKIAEHWHAVETIPAPETWKNNWGKFNFFNK